MYLIMNKDPYISRYNKIGFPNIFRSTLQFRPNDNSFSHKKNYCTDIQLNISSDLHIYIRINS